MGHLILNRIRRTHLFVLSFILTLGLTGCVGRREALKTAEHLATTSQTAVAAIENLKAGAQAEVEAHRKTRELAKQMHNALVTQVRSNAEAQIELALRVEISRVKEAERAALEAMIQSFVIMSEKTPNVVATQTKPFSQKIEQLLAQRNDAKSNALAFPGDLSREVAYRKSQEAYIVATEQKIEIERNAFREIYTNVGPVLASYVTKIKNSSSKITKSLNDQAAKSRASVGEKIAEQLNRDFDAGQDPRLNEEAYTNLLGYAQGVNAAANQMVGYLQLNSLGKNSALSVFLGSAGKGFIQGLPFIGSGQATSWNEAKTAFGNFANDTVATSKSELKEAANTGRTELNNLKKEAVTATDNAMKSTVDNLIGRILN